MIRGLVFDCDGTLADTMPLHWVAWNVVAKKYGLHFPEERFYALGGVPSRDILKMLREEQGLAFDHLALAKEKEAAYFPLLQEVREIELVARIARENFERVPMAVASGGARPVIETLLEHLGL